jgi:hypothetical protein
MREERRSPAPASIPEAGWSVAGTRAEEITE